MGTYFLETPRLGFRIWTREDEALARALWGDPEVTARIDARGALSASEVAQKLAAEIACMEAHGVQYWPLFLRSSGEHVGCCGLRPRDGHARIFELGFHLFRAAWGKGYATEAAKAIVDYAFDVLGASGLFAGHHPENHASRRTLEKLGF